MSSLEVRRRRGIRFSSSDSFLGLEGAEVVVRGSEGKVGLEGIREGCDVEDYGSLCGYGSEGCDVED